MIVDGIGRLVRLSIEHGFWWIWVLPPAGFWGLGRLIIANRKHKRGPTAVGLLATLGIAGLAWQKRRLLSKGAMVLIVAVASTLFALAVIGHPALLGQLVQPVAFVLAVAWFFPAGLLWPGQPGGLLDEQIGDRTMGDWWDDRYQRERLRASTRAGGKIFPGRHVVDIEDGWEIDVESRSGVEPDHRAIGAAANQMRMPVAAVRPVPDPKAVGRYSVQFLRTPPPDEWERLAVPRPWEQASSRDPDASIPIGFRPDQSVVSIGGPHPKTVQMVGIVGVQRAGKSNLLGTIVAEWAFRDHAAMVLLDPQRVEFAPWKDRATILALGVEECQRALERVAGTGPTSLINRRAIRVQEMRNRHTAPVGPKWPRVMIAIDESATLGTDPRIADIAARGGKYGLFLVIATQRPEAEVWAGQMKENITFRVSFKLTSGQASRMIFPGGPDCTRIPYGPPAEATKGLMIVQNVAEYVSARSFYLRPKGPVHPDDEPIPVAAAEIARATARKRIGWGDC